VTALFERRGFRDLFIGQSISAFGDWMVTFAIMWLALKYSGSSTAVGGVLVLRLLPTVLAGSAVTRVVGRWDRRRAMLLMDLIRAAIVLAIPFIRGLWWLYLWAFVLELCGLVFLPARDAAVPDLVDDDELPQANGLVMVSSFGTIPLGAGAFALMSALTPDHGWGARFPFLPAFAFDAASFLVSFAVIYRLSEVRVAVEREEHEDAPTPRMRDALKLPLVRAVMPATVVISVGLGTLFSLGVVYIRDVLGTNDAEFGVLIVLFGVGASIGLGILTRLGNLDRIRIVQLGTFAQGLTIGVMSLSPWIGPAFLGAAAFGAATACTLATGISVLQEGLEGDERVLALATFHVVIRGGLALAAMGAGVAGDLVGSAHLPVLGHLEPSRIVLLCAGALTVLGSGLIRAPAGAAAAPTSERAT
jgi:dTMP kinase